MNENNWEVGYPCDIALERLMDLYFSSSEFNRDRLYITTKPRLHQPEQNPRQVDETVIYGELLEKLKKIRGRESVLLGLLKNGDNYTRLSREWARYWRTLLKTIPDGIKLEAEKIAETWGLRCKWGCGFIFLENPSFYRFNFMLRPGTLYHRTTQMKINISVDDTDETIRQKIKDLKIGPNYFEKLTKSV